MAPFRRTKDAAKIIAAVKRGHRARHGNGSGVGKLLAVYGLAIQKILKNDVRKVLDGQF